MIRSRSPPPAKLPQSQEMYSRILNSGQRDGGILRGCFLHTPAHTGVCPTTAPTEAHLTPPLRGTPLLLNAGEGAPPRSAAANEQQSNSTQCLTCLRHAKPLCHQPDAESQPNQGSKGGAPANTAQARSGTRQNLAPHAPGMPAFGPGHRNPKSGVGARRLTLEPKGGEEARQAARCPAKGQAPDSSTHHTNEVSYEGTGARSRTTCSCRCGAPHRGIRC